MDPMGGLRIAVWWSHFNQSAQTWGAFGHHKFYRREGRANCGFVLPGGYLYDNETKFLSKVQYFLDFPEIRRRCPNLPFAIPLVVLFSVVFSQFLCFFQIDDFGRENRRGHPPVPSTPTGNKDLIRDPGFLATIPDHSTSGWWFQMLLFSQVCLGTWSNLTSIFIGGSSRKELHRRGAMLW